MGTGAPLGLPQSLGPESRPTIGLSSRHGDKAGPPLQAQSLRRRWGQFWATSSCTELSLCSPVDPKCSCTRASDNEPAGSRSVLPLGAGQMGDRPGEGRWVWIQMCSYAFLDVGTRVGRTASTFLSQKPNRGDSFSPRPGYVCGGDLKAPAALEPLAETQSSGPAAGHLRLQQPRAWLTLLGHIPCPNPSIPQCSAQETSGVLGRGGRGPVV